MENATNSQELKFLKGYQERHTKARIKEDAKGEDEVAAFWDVFSEQHKDISDLIDAMENDLLQTSSSQKSAVLDERVAKILESIQEIEQRITDSAFFLASYDVRRSQQDVNALKEALSSARLRLAPRKKFTFRSKNKTSKKEQCIATGPVDSAERPGTDTSNGSRSTVSTSMPPKPPPVKGEKGDEQLVTESGAGLFSLSNKTIVERTDPTGQHGPPKDYILKDLDSCVVALLRPFGCLRLENLRGCVVMAGPVGGACYAEGLRDCRVAVAPRQLRIHGTTSSSFYTHPGSGPIIEDCSGVRFGPYPVRYEGLSTQIEGAGLPPLQPTVAANGAAITIEHWKSVKDFRWHKIQQSPNWSLLSPEEHYDFSQHIFPPSCSEDKPAQAAEEETSRDQNARTSTIVNATADNGSKLPEVMGKKNEKDEQEDGGDEI
mmetsp:Transcript_4009/g.7112  ORF Transcript_4009/g.7112 Transcript_4009/m.7112 type:complete len:433 (-) Transcript_4009:305-1603(-)